MKPVITENEATHYVDEADFIKFIEQNSDYNWDYLCDICRDEIFGSEGKVYYANKPALKYHTEFAVKWVGAFFDAHPFMSKIMIVFDD